MKLLKLVVALLLGSLIASSAASAAPLPKAYANCTALAKVYPNGVANSNKATNKGVGAILKPAVSPSVYKLNARLDKDRDGIACEVLAPKAKPQPGATPTSVPRLPDDYEAAKAPLETCRLRESQNFSGAGAKGFPIRNSVPATGEVKIAVAPIDFDNARGVGNPKAMFTDDIAEVEAWAKFFGRGALTYDAELISGNWIRAPRGAEWYVCAECGKGAVVQRQSKDAALRELVKTIDPLLNFAGVDFVYFVFPYQAEREFGTTVYSGRSLVSTDEGEQTIAAYGEMGGFAFPATMDRTKIWDHLIHEILHFQGQVGHGPLNGSDLGILMNQWGQSKAVTGWEAFLSGWFTEPEVLCLDSAKLASAARVTLSSIDVFGAGPEVVFVRMSDRELVAIEYRSNGKYTNLSEAKEIRASTALTAYRVDVNALQYRNDADPSGDVKNFWWFIRESGNINITKSTGYKNLRITRLADNQVQLEILQ